MHMCCDCNVVIYLNFHISLMQSSTHGINPNLCERSPPPPPLLTSCTELELLHEKSCSQPHYCEYLYAHCQDCAKEGESGGRARERASERESEERWREYSLIWIQLENYQARTARTERKAHRRCVANISPTPRPLRSDTGENGAPCRRRARLCGGGHRKEAHPQGNGEGAYLQKRFGR